MNAVRKLSIVGCPQRDGREIESGSIVYGAPSWSRTGCPLKPLGTPIKANQNGGDLHAIMFAQSKLTRNGVVARAPDPVTAKRILASDNKPHRVTVPSQRESPRAAPTGQGGAFPSRHAADNGESRDFMAVNAQADAQACVGTFAEGRETSVPVGRSLASTEYQAGDQHRPLPPYSNTPAAAYAAEDTT